METFAALMLVFVISQAGEAATAAVRFDSMATCEARRAEAMTLMQDYTFASGAKVEYVAAACVKPAKVQAS